jgi:thiamine-phosphate pyrophosphorylase
VTLTGQARRLNSASGRVDLPALILMTDETRLPDPRAAMQRLPYDAAILLRHSDPHARRRLAEEIAPICRARDLLLIVSSDIALAESIDADGLHLPERCAAGVEASALRRRWRGLLTCAAHSPKALRRAETIGADAVLVSPVFATASHPNASAIGLMRMLMWSRNAQIPIYALGGVTASTAGRLRSRAIVGIAGIGGLI